MRYLRMVVSILFILSIGYLISLVGRPFQTPNPPPLPKGGVYRAYVDDLYLSINNVTVFSDSFSSQSTSLRLNDRAAITGTLYLSPPGSLELSQELDTYDRGGTATLDKHLSFAEGSLNLTASFYVSSENMKTYSGGFDIGFFVNTMGLEGDATIYTLLLWNSLHGDPGGLAFHLDIGYRDHDESSGVSVSNPSFNGTVPNLTFDEWHTVGVILNSGNMWFQLDGDLYKAYTFDGEIYKVYSYAKEYFNEVESVSLRLLPHLFM